MQIGGDESRTCPYEIEVLAVRNGRAESHACALLCDYKRSPARVGGAWSVTKM